MWENWHDTDGAESPYGEEDRATSENFDLKAHFILTKMIVYFLNKTVF